MAARFLPAGAQKAELNYQHKIAPDIFYADNNKEYQMPGAIQDGCSR